MKMENVGLTFGMRRVTFLTNYHCFFNGIVREIRLPDSLPSRTAVTVGVITAPPSAADVGRSGRSLRLPRPKSSSAPCPFRCAPPSGVRTQISLRALARRGRTAPVPETHCPRRGAAGLPRDRGGNVSLFPRRDTRGKAHGPSIFL